MPANDFEISKRREKVSALLAQLDAFTRMCGLSPTDDAPLLLDIVSKWTHRHWASLAVSAGKRAPSETTVKLVMDALKARIRGAA